MKEHLKDYGIHHVCFVTRDMEKSKKRIEQLFGVNQWLSYIYHPDQARVNGEEVDDFQLRLSMGEVKDETCKIEVIEPITQKGPHAEVLKDPDCGLHHICFQVDDYDRWLEHFLTVVAEIVYESVTEDQNIGYRRCFYAKDDVLACYYEILEKPYFRK